jgi:zinc protease
MAVEPVLTIPYARETLGNGLSVIVHEDHRCPIVAVDVWFRVGSKDERPGRRGFAHLFEHLMFEGSAHYDRSVFHPLQQAGAALNGSTNADRTNYWEVVPPGALALALWLESDRMGYLLPALTPEKFANQRAVVLNERRQHYENRPYGLAPVAIAAALFPPDHPYHWITIGRPEDLRAATLEDAAAFARTYYHPANASLAIAGDVDTDRAFELARHYFEEIPAGPPVPPVEAPPVGLVGEQRLVLEDRVELPRLYVAWPSPAMFAPGDAEMDLVADLLGAGKTSRLYRALVYERRLATEVTAAQHSRQLASFFQIVVTAAPGRTLGEIDAVLTAEIARFADVGPTEDEMARGAAQIEAQFWQRLQSVGGFGGKADQLNAYRVFLGDPGGFAADLDRYRRATAGALRDAARAVLSPDRRVALSVVPLGGRGLALAGSAPVAVS